MKETIKTIIIIVLVGLVIYWLYNKESNEYPKTTSLSREEKIDYLKEENTRLEEQINELNSKLENLESDYEYDEELIQLLKDQLLSYGIEPDEL